MAAGFVAGAALVGLGLAPSTGHDTKALYPDLVEGEAERAAQAKLGTIVRFQFSETPFEEVLQELERKAGAPFELRMGEHAEEHIPGLRRIRISFSSPSEGVVLAAALTTLTRMLGLDWRLLGDGSVRVGTKDELLSPCVLRIYDVADILERCYEKGWWRHLLERSGLAENEDRWLAGENLMDFMKECIDRQIWCEAENHTQFRSNKLFVTAPLETQRKIQRFLKAWRETGTRPVTVP